MNAEPIVWVAIALAAIPAVMTLWNHLVYRKPPSPEPGGKGPGVSVLIPARDEAANIESAVRAALASEGVEIEVVVLDDHSTDETAAIVRRMAGEDSRVRLESAPELPSGWCGKQHACARLAEHARHDLMLFVDADVKMNPAAVSALAAFLETSRSNLVSAFPRQVTGTFLEKLLIPLIEFLLLGYLPILFGRWSTSPGYAAGCGQVFLARREGYRKAGGHAVIRESLHDGIKLPRAFRRAGLRTDLCDGSGLFTCRMYDSARSVWFGLMKNAHEGIASPALILPFTLLLFGAAVLPLFVIGREWGWLALGLAYLPRAANAWRFDQSWLGVLFHPLSVLLFLLIQWQAFFRRLAGKKPEWRGRAVG